MGWWLSSPPLVLLLHVTLVILIQFDRTLCLLTNLELNQSDNTLLQSLGLSKLPDVNKMNVSQEEYSRMVNIYLRRVKHKEYSSSYQSRKFYTIPHSGEITESDHSKRHLHFEDAIWNDHEVESASLRMLVSAERLGEEDTLELEVFERREGESEEIVLLHKRSLSKSMLPIWTDSPIKSSNLTKVSFEVRCNGVSCRLDNPVLNVFKTKRSTRAKRHAYRTDCFSTGKRPRCCRHKMDVVFKELPGYEFIIQPYVFDAGYCKGSCPYRYNPANHHSSLQSLVWRQKKGAAPKPCCAPSKLEELDIIYLDENDPSKLKMTTWSSMKVIECACS